MRRILIVTAVEAERTAVLRGLGRPDRPAAEELAAGHPVVVVAGGVGVAAAAATTATYLTLAAMGADPFDTVLSTGVAGGFPGRAEVGATVLGARSVAAELGADSPDGFIPLEQLGFGQSTVEADATLLAHLARALPHAVTGEILTVSTVTGTAERAAALLARRPDAVAEAMEGFGVATATAATTTAFVELRTISNPVGPRDRGAWRLDSALAALTEAMRLLPDLGSV